MRDLHELPKLRDGLSYLYLEHGVIERSQNAVEFFDKKLTLFADDFFTHSVVFTPTGRPFFCIENQSCSTDAHIEFVILVGQ